MRLVYQTRWLTKKAPSCNRRELSSALSPAVPAYSATASMVAAGASPILPPQSPRIPGPP
jgi:hypothetical protein